MVHIALFLTAAFPKKICRPGKWPKSAGVLTLQMNKEDWQRGAKEINLLTFRTDTLSFEHMLHPVPPATHNIIVNKKAMILTVLAMAINSHNASAESRVVACNTTNSILGSCRG